MTLAARDQKYLWRESEAAFCVKQTNDSVLIDTDGKEYIDFLSGWCVGNMGWNNAAIRDCLKNYTGPEFVQPALMFEPWVELAELLAKITPGDLQVSVRATGGTEAAEIALQIAMAVTKRTQLVSLENSYHGHSLGALSIGSSYYRKRFSNLLPHCHKLSPPLNDHAADQLEQYLKNKDVAAFIMEPIVCNLGVEIPTESFMQRASALCKKYDTLFILDEVMTGFMRTGKMFAAEHFDVTPDILCMAKGITGGYGVLGAAIVTEAVSHRMKDHFGFYSTFGWQPIAVVAALANIRSIISNKSFLEKNIEALHHYFIKRLSQMPFKTEFHIQAKGLAIVLHVDNAAYVAKLVLRMRDNGVYTSQLEDNMIALFPALTMSPEIAKRGMDAVETSVVQVPLK